MQPADLTNAAGLQAGVRGQGLARDGVDPDPTAQPVPRQDRQLGGGVEAGQVWLQ
jgi:hypothetical protein